MSILNSKNIQNIINDLSHLIRKNEFKDSEIPKFVFVCGKQIIDESGSVIDSKQLVQNEDKRQFLIDRLSSNNLICIISEKIYDSNSIVDTLTFEELLAELSQDIIIIIESPGTICELGAFTVNHKFFKKLLVINDLKYKHEKSFINEGPVRKLITHNEERYILINDDYELFKSNFEISNYIEKTKKNKISITPNNDSNKLDLKNLIYELLNIIDLFEPITKFELFYIYKKVKNFEVYEIENREKHKINSPTSVINLMKSMELVSIDGEYIRKEGDYKYYNSLFNIKKQNYNEIRTKIVYEIMGKYPERLGEDRDANITINE
jgi:hypothetical protein